MKTLLKTLAVTLSLSLLTACGSDSVSSDLPDPTLYKRDWINAQLANKKPEWISSGDGIITRDAIENNEYVITEPGFCMAFSDVYHDGDDDRDAVKALLMSSYKISESLYKVADWPNSNDSFLSVCASMNGEMSSNSDRKDWFKDNIELFEYIRDEEDSLRAEIKLALAEQKHEKIKNEIAFQLTQVEEFEEIVSDNQDVYDIVLAYADTRKAASVVLYLTKSSKSYDVSMFGNTLTVETLSGNTEEYDLDTDEGAKNLSYKANRHYQLADKMLSYKGRSEGEINMNDNSLKAARKEYQQYLNSANL